MPQRNVIWDVEGDGLLDTVSKIHCMGFIDADTEEEFLFDPDTNGGVEEGFRWMDREVACIIGHNIQDYDFRACKKVYPKLFHQPESYWDTLLMVRQVWPAETLLGPDLNRYQRGLMPGNLMKRHSLKAWGYRLGEYKGDPGGGWDVWTPSMSSYMMQDCRVNLKLWKLIRKRIGWDNPAPDTYVWPELPFWIERECSAIIRQQESVGVWFDREAAIKLASELKTLQHSLGEKLTAAFKPWWQPKDPVETGMRPKAARKVKRPDLPNVTIPRYGKKGSPLKPYIGPPIEEYHPDAPYVRVEWTEFNPKSRHHLAQRLRAEYGWEPTQFTETGLPLVDEGAIKAIDESVIGSDLKQTILDYFVVSKTLGYLVDGKENWLDCCDPNQRIHGQMDPLGTITTRANHFKPNLGNIPAVEVKETKDPVTRKVIHKEPILGLAGGYGYECRGLFGPEPGWELTGMDASSLELIGLGHYLWPFDEGELSARVCDPERDPHYEHGEITGLPRSDTKTATYCYIYGGGPPKVGVTVGWKPEEEEALLKDGAKSISGWVRFLKEINKGEFREPTRREKVAYAKGKMIIDRFLKAITGLKELKNGIQATAKARGWLKGIDGRKLIVRKDYAALNALIQGMGAILVKLWMILLHERLQAAGLVRGKDYNQVLWVHDEFQIEHRPGLGPLIGAIGKDTIREAGRRLGLRGELRADFKTGKSWAETH